MAEKKLVNVNLLYVLKRFPEHKHKFERLCEIDEAFQSLCDDYQECTEALKHWNQSSSEQAHVRQMEYAELLKVLEIEIIRYI